MIADHLEEACVVAGARQQARSTGEAAAWTVDIAALPLRSFGRAHNLAIGTAGIHGRQSFALRGRNALRRFRNEVRERGAQVAWFIFRERALEQIAADWLDANGIAYRRG